MNHFLDIGANIGNTFDWFLLKTNEYDGFHIWCFEPSPRHLTELRKRCQTIVENNEHNYAITICPFGLSDFNGHAPLFETHDSLGDSLYETSFDRPIDLLCAVFEASEFIMEEIPEGRLTLKIDPEGSETEIMNSIMRVPEIMSRIDKILIEFHTITAPQAERIRTQLAEEKIPVVDWVL